MNDGILARWLALEKQYKNACLMEVEAIKPGNVHVFADGHGMQVQDFIKSAEVSASVIVQPGLTLGERIYQSVDATWQAVRCNTNLGIVLLCAPIIHCALQGDKQDLQKQLFSMLQKTSVEDAQWVFKAILRANPAGLGRAQAHDVNDEATGTLLEVMQAAAKQDMIALQYANGFSNLFDEGVPQYQRALARLDNASWAITEVYLYWLSQYLDSHILRKYGLEVAQQVQDQALDYFKDFRQQSNPRQYFSELMHLDEFLKSQGLNPGTSADLTVATVLLHTILEPSFNRI